MLYVFRKNLIALLLFASGLFTIVGCESDVKGHPEPEHLVTISLPASLLKASTEESLINSVVFFGVDAVGNYVDKYSINAMPAASQSLTISRRVTEFYAIANPTEAMVTKTPSKTELDAMTVGFTDGKPILPILMSGWGEINNDNSVSIDLVRSVAKIEINGKKGFKVTEITVANTPDKGYVFQGSTLTIPDGRGTYTSTDTILYVAENTGGAGATQFTVTGTYDNKEATYNFVLDNNLDIIRNKHYRVGISPITSSVCTFDFPNNNIPDWVDAPATNDQVIVKPNPYKNGIKILAIGNSYSENAMEFMYDLLKQVGITGNIKLVNAYRSGCTLEQHVNFNAVYERQLYNIIGGGCTKIANKKLIDLIKEDTWDVITLQQGSRESGMSSTYGTYLTTLIDYVRQHANGGNTATYKLGWHMTWTWSQNFWTFGNGSRNTNSWYNVYSKDQETFYQAICDVVQTVIVPKLKTNGGADFDFIIPAGTAIHNARKPAPLGFGDNLNYDGTHLDNRGCYIAAAMWIKTITGYDIAKLTTPYRTWGWDYYDIDLGTTLIVNDVTIARTGDVVPGSQTRASFEIIQKAVNAAAATPLATTPYTNLNP